MYSSPDPSELTRGSLHDGNGQKPPGDCVFETIIDCKICAPALIKEFHASVWMSVLSLADIMKNRSRTT